MEGPAEAQVSEPEVLDRQWSQDRERESFMGIIDAAVAVVCSEYRNDGTARAREHATTLLCEAFKRATGVVKVEGVPDLDGFFGGMKYRG